MLAGQIVCNDIDNYLLYRRIAYGVRYQLWRPLSSVHEVFPKEFQQAVMAVSCCTLRSNCPLSRLPPDVIHYLLNMVPYDWFQPDGADDARVKKQKIGKCKKIS